MKNLNSGVSSITYCQYARKSSESKERQALSINDQKEELSEYCKRENVFVADSFKFEEEKTSYKPDKRPIFKRMIELIEAGHVQAVVTWKPDRLCRNPKEGGIIMQLLQDRKLLEIRTVSENSVYTPDSDHLVLQIHFGMANQYSRVLSSNVKRGLKHKANRGQYTSRPPLGYEGFGEAPNKNIRPHQFEGPLIKEAFEMMATGMNSLQTIVEFLHKKGLKTKAGKKISKSHLQSIFNSPTYYGYFVQTGELHEGNFDPIVTKTLFDKAQVGQRNRSKPKVHAWKPFLNGIVKCGECGCAITTTVKIKKYKRTGNTQEYRYNHCTHRKGVCSQPPITSEEIEDQLTTSIDQISIDEEVWQLGMTLLRAKFKNEMSKNTVRLKEYQSQMLKLSERLTGLIDMRADGEITKDQFDERKKSILNEQAKVKSLLDDYQRSAKNWVEQAEEMLDTALNCHDVLKDGAVDEKRELILRVGENFFLKDGKLTFQMKKPYDVLLRPEVRTNVMPD
jgi:site-specific DNA recombinase